MIYRTAEKTDVGKARDGNEDRLIVVRPEDPAAGVVLCVADGMGGHPAGEEASQIVVDRVAGYADAAEAVLAEAPDDLQGALAACLLERVREAHDAILAVGRADRAKAGLGTTIVAALLREGRVHVIHCGDSRAYLLRGDALVQLTEDHVVVEGGMRFLSAHVGMFEGFDVEETGHDLESGDRLLVCSDGLTDMVPPEVFGATLYHAEDAEEAVEGLVELALTAGGLDNVSCVVAFVE